MAGQTSIYVAVTQDGLSTLERRAVAQRRTAEVVAATLLRDALHDLPATGRHVVLDHATLDALAEILGGGDVLNGPDLVAKIERLAGITFHNIRLEFTPGQLEELARRAERLSLTPEELTRRTIERMEQLFFTHLGVGAAG